MIKSDQTYSIPDHVLIREIDGEAIILDLEKGEYCGLNDVGHEFINGISKGTSFGAVVSELSKIYDVSLDVLEADLSSLVDQLISSEIIRADDALSLIHI